MKGFNNLIHVSLHKLVPCSVEFLQMWLIVSSIVVEIEYNWFIIQIKCIFRCLTCVLSFRLWNMEIMFEVSVIRV